MSKFKLGDVASEKRATWNQEAAGVPVVGLEHLVPGDVLLKNWTSDVPDSTFTKSFKKGQVLLGRRRVYLRKAVLAPFDGICSGDITVIEADANKLAPELLPFIIQNDKFFNFAMQGSAGSLSPRVKWAHLADYEFNLPAIDKQRRLADLLWAANDLKEAYKRAIAASDEMLKAKFREMFGGNLAHPQQNWVRLASVGEIVSGSTPKTEVGEYWDGDLRWLAPAEIQDDSYYIFDSVKKITSKGAESCSLRLLHKETVIFTSRASIGKVALAGTTFYCNQGFKNIICSEKILPKYLYCLLRFNAEFLQTLGCGGTFKEISKKTMDNIMIPLPPIKLQQSFALVMDKFYQAKQLMNKTLADITSTIKAIVNQALEA